MTHFTEEQLLPSCLDCNSLKIEANGLCGSCNRLRRKKEEQESKPAKPTQPIKRISDKQVSIKGQLQRAYAEMARVSDCQTICSGCEQSYWDDHDHTISQKRCKDLDKPELITDLGNLEYSCRQCHVEWESYKDGKFIKHNNFEKRMAFVKLHDPEMWERRIAVWETNTKPSETI